MAWRIYNFLGFQSQPLPSLRHWLPTFGGQHDLFPDSLNRFADGDLAHSFIIEVSRIEIVNAEFGGFVEQVDVLGFAVR